jgi:hypothetical protein
MEFCTACGRPWEETDRFCAGCGTELPAAPLAPAYSVGLDDTDPDGIPVIWEISPVESIVISPGEQPASYDQSLPVLTADRAPVQPAQEIPPFPLVPFPEDLRQPSRRRRGTMVLAVFGLALLVIAAGALALTSMRNARTVASTATTDPPRRPASPRATARQPPPSPARTPHKAARAGIVTVSAAAADSPATAAVTALLGRYFTAINSRDYAAYESLLDGQMRQRVSASRFASGYATTKDSAATVTGISGTADRLAAAVTFTSHQQPADSPSGSSCTAWAITLYLVRSGGGYLIGTPAPGYQASYRSC